VAKLLPDWYVNCDKCREYADSEPMLLHAFASVGIEHGKSSGQMAEEYFAEFHRSGHNENFASADPARKGEK